MRRDKYERNKILLLNSVLILVFFIIGTIVSYRRGQDINFDQLNYHFYTASRFWLGKVDSGITASPIIHSFFNPIIYLPFYLMVESMPPALTGIILGGFHCLNLWIVWVIAWNVTRGLSKSARVVTGAAAMVISAASPMALSEIGTSMSDISTSLPVLGGLALLLKVETLSKNSAWVNLTILLAGALVGVAAGLKLTNVPFAVALLVSAIIGWKNWEERFRAFFVVSFGLFLGAVASGGFWSLWLWQMFHNPFFPLFNSFFHSPDYSTARSFRDGRFLPHGLVDALSYPFRWRLRQNLTAELLFRDIRFALLVLLGMIILILAIVARSSRRFDPVMTMRIRLIIFFTLSFGLWMYEWSIQRYIVSLELLIGPIIIVLLRYISNFMPKQNWSLAGLASVTAFGCVITVVVPDWGHLAWTKHWYEVNVPTPKSSTPIYFLDGAPLAYIASELPSNARVIGITSIEDLPAMGDTVFLREITALLGNPDNNEISAISRAPLSEPFLRTISKYGLEVGGECKRTEGRPFNLVLCDLKRAVP